jgi:hypothetical protein
MKGMEIMQWYEILLLVFVLTLILELIIFYKKFNSGRSRKRIKNIIFSTFWLLCAFLFIMGIFVSDIYWLLFFLCLWFFPLYISFRIIYLKFLIEKINSYGLYDSFTINKANNITDIEELLEFLTEKYFETLAENDNK